ncbi:MAG: hypothetical protein ACREN7_07045, partial [Candidatus Dormibacteria bacterium]
EGIGFQNNSGLLVKAAYPFIAGATNALGPLKYVMYIAGFSSALGVMLATGNAGSRVLFNTAREGLMPRVFSRTHPTWRTPWVAMLFPNIAVMILTLILGGFVGGGNAFDYAVTLATDILVVVFIVTNISFIVYGLRAKGVTFSWWRHGALPALGVVALGYPLYEGVAPSQPTPYNVYGLLIIFAYVIAFAYVYFRRHSGHRVGTMLAVDEAPGAAQVQPASS